MLGLVCCARGWRSLDAPRRKACYSGPPCLLLAHHGPGHQYTELELEQMARVPSSCELGPEQTQEACWFVSRRCPAGITAPLVMPRAFGGQLGT